jgi:hypothetical protein
MNASITCQCGKIEIAFTSKSPRISTECCCNHCFARVKYLYALGGSNVPQKPLLASKWDNKVQILKGREFLHYYKLTKETLVINIASSCCHTFLLGRHPCYDTNCVTTSSDFPIWKNAEMPFIASSRWFSNQWRPEHLAQHPPLIGIWVNELDNSITGDKGWEPVFKTHLDSMNRAIPTDAEGETFDQIIDSIGKEKLAVISETKYAAIVKQKCVPFSE